MNCKNLKLLVTKLVIKFDSKLRKKERKCPGDHECSTKWIFTSVVINSNIFIVEGGSELMVDGVKINLILFTGKALENAIVKVTLDC